MMLRRGDIVLVHYPFSSGVGGSRRPALVVQNDVYNRRIRNTLVAQITTNLARADDSAHYPIRIATFEGRESGLLHDCVVSCINLATIVADRVDRVIGHLPNDSMQKIDGCLAVSLDLAGKST
jgi:mRNA interferase MazF